VMYVGISSIEEEICIYSERHAQLSLISSKLSGRLLFCPGPAVPFVRSLVEPKTEGATVARKVRTMGRLALMMHRQGSSVVQRSPIGRV